MWCIAPSALPPPLVLSRPSTLLKSALQDCSPVPSLSAPSPSPGEEHTPQTDRSSHAAGWLTVAALQVKSPCGPWWSWPSGGGVVVCKPMSNFHFRRTTPSWASPSPGSWLWPAPRPLSAGPE